MASAWRAPSIVLTLSLLLLPSRALGDASQITSSPPSGLAPAGATLAQMLARYRHAQGVTSLKAPVTLVIHETYMRDNVAGSVTEIDSGENARIDDTFGPDTESSGTFDGHDWTMDANGQVVIDQGIHHELQIDSAALRSAIAHGNAPGVALLGRIAQPVDAYVLQVNPPKGVFEYLYIDAQSLRLAAKVLRYSNRSERFVYDDYRTTAGVAQPWHTHEWIEDRRANSEVAGHEIDWHVAGIQVGGNVDPHLLAVPQSAALASLAQPRLTLPAKILGDRIIVTARLGVRAVNLQLDSGADGVFIDDAIIRALGYPITSDRAVIPSLTIGNLSMRDVHVTAQPYEAIANDGSPVAGLIGFDLINGVVLHVDYAGGSVEAIDPQSFSPPAGAVAIPIALDDQVPAVEIGVGSDESLRFLIDTGADDSILFARFARDDAGALLQGGIVAETEAASPFLGTSYGVGGAVKFQSVEAGPLSVAAWHFAAWPFDLVEDPRAFDLEDYEGILGQDFLRYYDVYFDYPHSRIWLAPNSRYQDRFGT
jgi:hypothetical protein